MDEMIFNQQSLGGKTSPPDYRDVNFGRLLAGLGTSSPTPISCFIDVSLLPIWNQKKLGSCTGHAGAKYEQVMRFFEDNKVINFSPRWIYALAKAFDNDLEQGTYPRMIMKMGQRYGFATEDTCPNNSDLDHDSYIFQRKLSDFPPAAMGEALNYRVKGYAVVGTSASELKQAISEAKGCMLLMEIGKEWWTDTQGNITWNPEKILPLRPPVALVGRHEVYLYGYDQVGGRDRFHFVNSFSKDWGNAGKGYFFYDEWQTHIKEAITAVDLSDVMLRNIKGFPSPTEFRHNFIVDLQNGDNGEDVKALQIALLIDGSMQNVDFTDVAFLGYFGEQTQAAVKTFQQKYNLPVTGLVSTSTNNQLNSLFNK